MCGRHARYLSPDIVSIYAKGGEGREEGKTSGMVVPVGDSFTYW